MAYDLEEQEKLDALRDWWAQYGTLLVTLVFVAVAAVAGWRGWQWYQSHQASQAMGYFEALERAVAQPGDEALERINAASQTLRDDFPKSGYTSRGLLIAAQAFRERGDLDEASAQLEWLISQSPDKALVHLARLRLSGILLDQDRFDDALAQLNQPPAAFKGLYADRRGDILRAQNKPEEAAQQWETALSELGDDSLAQIVQLKLDALAGA